MNAFVNGNLPLVSVVVVNYNDKGHLKSCIGSILESKYPFLEVLLVDDGSIDRSLDLVRKEFASEAHLTIIENATNVGPAAARNIGGSRATGKYLAFLDSDTTVDSLWLKEAINIMECDPSIGAVQCKLLLPGNEIKFDYAGDYLSSFGILIQRVKVSQIDDGSLDKIEEIFAVKSAGMIIKRQVFHNIGMFDEDYFIYGEETDLCWRVWLSGYRIVFAPTSKVYHDFNVSLKDRPNRPKSLDKYHGPKNYISSLIKNFELLNLVKVLPLNLGIWVGISVWYILKRRLDWATYIMKGVFYNIIHLKQIWAKRLTVQRVIRKVPDHKIMPRIMKKTTLSYFLNKVLGSR
jgi:GT2 family glycosyltransferase